jgi:hypothetical protein
MVHVARCTGCRGWLSARCMLHAVCCTLHLPCCTLRVAGFKRPGGGCAGFKPRWRTPAHTCTGTGAAASALGLGSPRPTSHRDWGGAFRTIRVRPLRTAGLQNRLDGSSDARGSSAVCWPVPHPHGDWAQTRPHLHQDWAHPARISTRTGLAPARTCLDEAGVSPVPMQMWQG